MKTVAVACRGLAGSGAVPEVARREIEQLRRWFRIHPVSDQLPEGWAAETVTSVSSPSFYWLRRYGHAAREVAFAWAVLRDLRRLAQAGKIDGLLCHSHSVAAIAGSYIQRHYGLPVAMVTHGDIFDRPTGTYDPWLTWLYEHVTPVAYQCVDLVIALSPYMADLAERHGAPTERVVVVPNGVAPEAIGLDANCLDRAPSRRQRADSSELHILFVGRLAVEKGLDVLLQALHQLREDSIYPQLSIVGAGPLSRELHDFVDALGLAGQVSFLGPVARRELAALYRAADVVCVPSRSEPFAGVVLEALVAGTPVVGSRVGGIPSVVEDGSNGLLCQADDPLSFARAIKQIARDSEALVQMHGNARPSVWPRYSWETVGKELGAQLERVLDKRVANLR